MSATDYKFAGWFGDDKNAVKGNLKWREFEPKPFGESDVDIQITHTGICGTCAHTLRSGWGPTMYPICVGHEIVGRAVKVGPKVEKGIKIGDRVAVGAQSGACLECKECKAGLENYCKKMVATYNSKYPDGYEAKGGFADYWRGHSRFVFKLPDGIPAEEAAPMMCAGATMYSPLSVNGCGPGKRVGIIGIGGLGMYGLLYAKALGAEKVYAITRTSAKAADAKKLGADEVIATSEDKDWKKHHVSSLDLIVCTVNSPEMPLAGYLALLDTHGTFIQVGAPDDNIPSFNAFSLITKGVKMGGSTIGSPAEIEEMLRLSVEKKVKPMIQVRPLADANQAMVDFEENKARYRYVLRNEKHKA